MSHMLYSQIRQQFSTTMYVDCLPGLVESTGALPGLEGVEGGGDDEEEGEEEPHHEGAVHPWYTE